MAKKILLINDDELVVKTLARLLAAKGYQVETAQNAVEAVSKIQRYGWEILDCYSQKLFSVSPSYLCCGLFSKKVPRTLSGDGGHDYVDRTLCRRNLMLS